MNLLSLPSAAVLKLPSRQIIFHQAAAVMSLPSHKSLHSCNLSNNNQLRKSARSPNFEGSRLRPRLASFKGRKSRKSNVKGSNKFQTKKTTLIKEEAVARNQ